MQDHASEAVLSEALSRCLERLHNDPHLTPEDCIRDYPLYRDRLKPLVEVAIRLKQGADDERFRRYIADVISRKANFLRSSMSEGEDRTHD